VSTTSEARSAFEPKRAILFDLDGTLVESGPSITASIRHALAAIDGPQLDEATLRSFIGPPLRESFRDMAGLEGAALDQVVKIYREHQLNVAINMVELYPGIADLLADLRHAGVPLAVATSKQTQNARLVLEHTEISDYFEVISGAEPGRMEKRHSIETARDHLAQTGVDLSDAVMIGDRIHDIAGAAHFEMTCISVTWGYGTAEEWQQADKIAESVGQLRTFLLQG